MKEHFYNVTIPDVYDPEVMLDWEQRIIDHTQPNSCKFTYDDVTEISIEKIIYESGTARRPEVIVIIPTSVSSEARRASIKEWKACSSGEKLIFVDQHFGTWS